MVGLNVAAKYAALAMNARNGLNQAQRDGYTRISGKILKQNVDAGIDPNVALDALFGMVRVLVNQWDRENGYPITYPADFNK